MRGRADLLSRAQRGERAALEALCRQEWAAVYRVIAARSASRQEAEDLTQEVFVRALSRLEGFRPGRDGSFRPYLVAVARNLLRDRWRAHARAGARVSGEDPDELPAPGRGPQEAALAAEERAALGAALAGLSPDHREVLRLRLLEGRSAPQAAALLGRRPDAVRQLQHRALAALRAALDDDRHAGGGGGRP